MAGRRIVVTSGKGGVGKTTIVANLGMGLAALNKKVALVDADIGLRNLDVMMGVENRIVYDLVDVVEGNCRLRQALIKDRKFNSLYLLPAAQAKDKESVTPEQMCELAQELAVEFDYVIVDSPAGIDRGFKNAVATALEAIVVTSPEVASIRDADRVIGLLESQDLKEPNLIINRVRPEMVKRGNMLSIEDVLEILSINLWGVIPDDEAVVIATNKGETVVLNNNAKSGQAFRNIVRRVEGEEVSLLGLFRPRPKGFWKRIKSLF